MFKLTHVFSQTIINTCFSLLQIVVATSIAEEGVDLPECELVIHMDPPSSVKALVQIRGRARKKGSRFIALCRNEMQKTALIKLMEHEKYMVDAVKNIVQKQNETKVKQVY